MASNKTLSKVSIHGHGRVAVNGSFRPNGTGSVSASNNKGKGFSVARTSAGLYTVTFGSKYAALDSFIAQGRRANGTSLKVVPGTYNAANKTMQLLVYDDSVGCIPLPLVDAREIATNDIPAAASNGGLLASDTTPILQRVNAATDKQLRLNWAAANVDEITWSAPLPPDLDDASAMTVALFAGMAGAADTPVISVGAFFNVGDTNCGGNTAALSSTAGLRTVSLAAGDVPAYPGNLAISLTPGAHGTDALYLYGAQLLYTKTNLLDMASDADSVISFNATFRNGSAGA